MRRRSAVVPGPAIPGLSRRSVLRGLAASGTVLGFAALGVFPAARRAYADGYDIYPSCPAYAADHDCSPGCGPSMIFGGACEEDGPHTGFHRNDGVDWALRPNQCYAGRYDGWLWLYHGACGSCACFVERRCNDGYHRLDSGWVKSICRWNTQCGCPEQPAPGPAPAPASVSWPTVGRGQRGVDVETVQRLLDQQRFPAETTGSFGPETELNVRVFQLARGIPPDGIVGAVTWLALVVPLRVGDRSPAVLALQRQLAAQSYAIGADSTFGPETDAAVRDLQRKAALPVTGVVDTPTWQALVGAAGEG